MTRLRIKLSDALPLAIWAIGLYISYVHIYRAALANGALAEVALLVPALFDLLVAFAAYVAITRVKQQRRGWATWWPASIAGLVLVASLWINTSYVEPQDFSEYLMTWAAVIGSFFAYELWRAMQGDTSDIKRAAATEAVEHFKAKELPRLLAEARTETLTPTPVPVPPRQQLRAPGRIATSARAESAVDQTRRLVAEYEAEHGAVDPEDQNQRNALRAFIEAKAGVAYHTARKRLVKVGKWSAA